MALLPYIETQILLRTVFMGFRFARVHKVPVCKYRSMILLPINSKLRSPFNNI